MNRLWWRQVKAVIRLELKRTFFARRGLWIYVLAALPVGLFLLYAVAMANQHHRTASIARQGDKPLTYQDLLAVKRGMTGQEVIGMLGKPPVNFHWVEPRRTESGSTEQVQHEEYRYSDGQNDIYISLVNGEVQNVVIQEGYNFGQDAVMFAGVFQFFF